MAAPIETAIIPYTPIDSFMEGHSKARKTVEKDDRMLALLFRVISPAPPTAPDAPVPIAPIVEAFQAEVAFSRAEDPRPMIASYGAGPCVIVAGYERKERVGFVAHFSHAGEVEVSKDKIMAKLSTMLRGARGNFELALKGGIIGDPVSTQTSSSIAKWVRLCMMGIVLTVVTCDPLVSPKDESKSVLLDTRTGAMRSYCPLKDNPEHYRRLTKSDVIWAMESFEKEPKLKCVYPTG